MSLKFLNPKALQRFRKDHIGEYDENDGYIFTNKIYFIPNALRPPLGLKKIRRDRRSRRYGRIKGHLFSYITTPMMLITAGLLYIVTKNISTLLVFFNTNIYLNGIIVSLMIFGILRVFFNSYLLFRAASFLRDLERISFKEKVTDDDIYKLRYGLEKKGELLNTIHMKEVIDDLEEKGFLNITDNRARFIKSKLGFRASRNRQGVNFISGILVMLGLLGTFLGLLGTIDSVGDALNSMANLGGGDGEIGMEQMTSFISSLAAPLQGMGLAFSSSLFGLSGSLLIGFFLHLAGTPQNFFIENVSRWIDDNIKKFHPKDLAKKATEDKSVETVNKAKVHATDQDLKDWLAGYVYLSTQTHRSLSTLTETITMSGKDMRGDVQALVPHLQDISTMQNSMAQHTGKISELATSSNQSLSDIRVSTKDIQDISHVMNTSLTSIDVVSGSIVQEIKNMTESVRSLQTRIKEETARKNAQEDKLLTLVESLSLETSKGLEIGSSAIVHLESSKHSIEGLQADLKKYSAAFYKEIKTTQQLKQESLGSEQQLMSQVSSIQASLEHYQSLHQANNEQQSKVITELLNTLVSEHKKIESLEKHVAELSGKINMSGVQKGPFSWLKKSSKNDINSDKTEDL